MRHSPLRRTTLLLAALTQLAAAPPPATSPSDAARLARGSAIRSVLLQLLEQSCRHDGVWPAALPPQPASADLTYAPPAYTPAADPDFAFKRASATVVLSESLDRHPDGVWVAYADGHLEFAPDAATLAECKGQLPLVRHAYAVYDAYNPSRATTKPSGQVTLRLLDPQGHPVSGALVGSYGVFGDDAPPDDPHAFFLRGAPPHAVTAKVTSDADGRVTLDTKDFEVGLTHLSRSPTVPIIILDEVHELSALVALSRQEFATHATRDVRVEPTCTVRGRLTSLALEPAGRSIHWSAATPFFEAGYFAQNPIECRSKSPTFELKLAPGDYELRFRTDETNGAIRYVHIPPGRREVNLQLDLPPIAFDLPYNPSPDIRPLIGHPAPELRSIQAWKNTAPLTLASLRGHVVLLDFWGYWCGNCVSAMPDLMKLYDEFHSQGLDVIAIHDNSVTSVAEMDQKLALIRAKDWSNRNLPFPVAIDGGRPPATSDDDHPFHGDTTTAYHVAGFPTTLVIGRDGNVLAEIDVRNPDTRSRIVEYLKSTPTAK